MFKILIRTRKIYNRDYFKKIKKNSKKKKNYLDLRIKRQIRKEFKGSLERPYILTNPSSFLRMENNQEF